MTLEKLVKDAKVIAIICNQWGDTGKGKFSDYFASQWADVIARGTGGNNAGHTVVVNGTERIFHLIPSGITGDAEGKINILGNGMVIDISVLCRELDELNKEGISYNNLMISKDANVIMPYHIARDVAKDKSQRAGGVGSTGRGIGPCYTDKVARKGILIEDLFDRDKLSKKIDSAKERYPEQVINTDEVIGRLFPFVERIKPFVRDTISEMREFRNQGKKILLEGAQGLLLSIEYGTYPYVTSSDCSLNGTAAGVGLSAKMVDLPLGIVKFPFMTRVGAGPFPSELGGRKSEDYCAEDGHAKGDELKQYGIPHQPTEKGFRYNPKDSKILEMIKSDDEFIQGIGIRLAAGEYGATTGRPRRTGWTDAVAARYAVGINGPLMILTKPDCLSDTGDFRLCFGYDDGKKVHDRFSRSAEFLRGVTPVHRKYGRYGDISDVRTYGRLPASLKNAITDFNNFTGGKVVAVSVSAERDATIIR
jgi:adenylosuccinate synthase